MRILTPFLFFITCITFGQQAFRDGKLYGFKESGKVIIAPEYDYAADFEGGSATVKKNGKWGFINAENKWIAQPVYDGVAPFQSGFSKVLKGGKFGLVDAQGNEVLAPEYDRIDFGWDGIEVVKAGKKGFYKEGYKQIPCKYERVGANDNGLAYGEVSSHIYDIYDKNGVLLKNQEHSFSSWNVRNKTAIAKSDNLFGLYNIQAKKWVIQPKFKHIQALFTEKFVEEDIFGEPTAYNHVYALFSEVEEVVYSLNEKASGKNKLAICTPGKLKMMVENLVGYEQITEGYGYNRTYDYRLDFSSGETKMLNTVLGISGQLRLEDEYSFFGAVVKKEDGMTGLYFDNELTLEAEEIKPIIRLESKVDAAGDAFVSETTESIPFLIIKQGDHVGLYDLDKRKLKLDGLPESTIFKLEKEESSKDYMITYSSDGKVGFFTNKIGPTSMDYTSVEAAWPTRYLIIGVSGEKKALVHTNNIKKVLVSGDDIEYISRYKIYGFIVQNNGKKGVYSVSRNDLSGAYDAVEFWDEQSLQLITRTNGKYGFHNLSSGESLPAIVDKKEDLVHEVVYPYYFARKEGKWIGIDGYTYDCLDVHDTFLTNEGLYVMGRYGCNDEDDIVYLSEDRYLDSYGAEIYPNFRVKGMNKKWGFVNHFGDTLVPFEYTDFEFLDSGYESLGVMADEEILMSYKKTGVGLLSTKRGVIIPAEYDYIEQDYDFLDWDIMALYTYKKKMEGLYVMGKGQVIPAVYKRLEHTDSYLEISTDTLLVVDKKNKMGLIGVNGNTVLPVKYDDLFYYNFERCYNVLPHPVIGLKENKKVGMYALRLNKIVVPTEFDDIIDGEFLVDESYSYEDQLAAFTTYRKGRKGCYDYHGHELLPPIFDEIYLYSDFTNYYSGAPQVVWGELKGKIYANINAEFDSTLALTFNEDYYFDKLVGPVGIFFVDGGFRSHNLLTGEQQTNPKELLVEGYEFDILYENGKFGAKDKEGNVIVEPSYESANFMLGRSEVMIGYEDGVKYYIYVFNNNERYTEEEW